MGLGNKERSQIKDTTKLLMAILTSHCEAAHARLERITLISIVVYVVEQSSISIRDLIICLFSLCIVLMLATSCMSDTGSASCLQ